MNENYEKENLFEPCCRATTIGSLPHIDVARATSLMFAATPELPSWVQFPRRVVFENMTLQFTEGLPALACEGDRPYFDTAGDDYVEQLTYFYERYLNTT